MGITRIANRLVELNFYNQYSCGEKNFKQANLDNINLSNKILTELDLRQAVINYSVFEKVSLTGSDLSKSSLISANFKKSLINNTVFNRANLTNAKLSSSRITDVSFFGACLYKASFCEATVNNVDFSFANLSAAYLARVDLSNSMFEGAVYNSDTAFPKGFDPVKQGMIHESEMFVLEQITAQFDSLRQRAKTFLGETITTKYLDSSRPEHDGLKQLSADENRTIILKGDTTKSREYVEAEYLRHWMISFANLCSKIIRNVEDDRELFSDGIFG